MIRKSFIGGVIAFLIVLFVYTAVHKILDFEKFSYEIGRSPFVDRMGNFVAVSIPAVEILITVLLVVNRTRLFGLYLSFFLMTLFTGYIWLMLTYAPDLPCSCGGIISSMSWRQHLWFNAGVSLLTVVALVLWSVKPVRKSTTAEVDMAL